MISSNDLLIRCTDLIAKLRPRRARVDAPLDYVGDIRSLCPREVACTKTALLSFVPSAWQIAQAEYPNIRRFNQAGLTFEMVKALNEKGYAVDIVDYTKKGVVPQRRYDFFLGHGGNTRSIIERLPESTFVMQYASGAYWKEFNRMSQDRYDHFCARRGLPPVARFVRSLHGTEDGEEFLARRADAVFTCGPRTMATLSGVSSKVFLLYFGASVEKDLIVPDRDFEGGRKNFLYVAGTGGNVQKGLDLLLEAFAQLPHLHLFIYCKVEDEVRRAYRKELAQPNIHYVHHYQYGPLRPVMRRLLQRINFTITAPINTGIGTAFLGSMGVGLIPVGYVDIEGSESNSVLTDTATTDSLVDCVDRASKKSAAWCRQASQETLERFQRLHEPSVFGANFKALLDQLGL